MEYCKRCFLAILFCTFSIGLAAGQSDFKINGRIGLYGDFYHMQSFGDSIFPSRRPPVLTRFLCNASFSWKDFSIPVSLLITPQQTSVITPALPSGNIVDFVENPKNNIGIAPKYKWIQLLLGTQTPHYSELTIGDEPLFGAGLNLNPGKFRFSVFTGNAQRPIEPDSTHNIPGAYRRKMYAGKVGVGKEDSSHIYLIAVKAEDDTSSLKTRPVKVLPQAGFVSSLDYRINFGKVVYLKGEMAGAAFTRDMYAKDIVGNTYIPSFLFQTKQSSWLNYAGLATLGKTGKNFSFDISGRYLGDGYISLAYPFLQSDLFDITFSPRIKMFKDHVNINATIGQRINNLSASRGSTATQTLANVSIDSRIGENFNLSAQYSNFGFRNNVMNDTLRIQMVSQSLNLTLSYILKRQTAVHVIIASASRDQFKDFNTVSGALNSNNTMVFVLNYNISFNKFPLSASVMASNFHNDLAIGSLTTNMLNLNGSYRLYKNRLNLNAGYTITQNTLGNSSPAGQGLVLLGIKYKLRKNLNLEIQGTINNYRYGSEKPGMGFREDYLRTSILYNF